jgi:hypothetical protein
MGKSSLARQSNHMSRLRRSSEKAGLWRYLCASYLAFNDVPERLPIAAARVDYQLRVRPNKRIIERVVVGGDDDAIHPGEQLRCNVY